MQITVAIEDLSAGDGVNAFAGEDDAGEVGGVGSSNGNGSHTIAVAGGAERIDGGGQGELFATEAGDEAAATNFAARFEAAENAEQVAPFGSVGFAGEEIAEEDAVAGEQHAG